MLSLLFLRKTNRCQRLRSLLLVVVCISACTQAATSDVTPDSHAGSNTVDEIKNPIVFTIKSVEEPKGYWQPRVSAKVGDISDDFIIDTGGEVSMLAARFLPAFAKREEKSITDSNGQRRTYQVGPVAAVADKARLDGISFMVLGDYLNLTHGKELWNANGSTIGMNALGTYRIRIDGPKGLLTLTSDDAPLQGSGWTDYSGFGATPHQTVEATTIKGEKLRVFLDTGNAQSRILQKFAGTRELPIQLVIGSMQIEATTPQVLEGDSELSVGDPAKNPIVVHATLGWDVLRHFIFEISPKNKRLRISKE